MYTLMIADDEIDKLESLRYNYDWQKCGISICCEAQDGMEAFKLLVHKVPDICIMDVRMPILSGLDAMKRAKDAGVSTKFIILSGYDDFDYAQKALSLSTVEYLLKPCKFSEVLQAVLKCINLIDEQRETSYLLENYRQLSQKNYQSMKHRTLVNFITGNHQSEKNFAAKGPLPLKFGFSPNLYAICVVAFEKDRLETYPDRDLLFARILDNMKKKSSEVSGNEVFVHNDQIIAIVSMGSICEKFNVWMDSLEFIITYTKFQFDLNCVIGVSDIKNNLALCHEAYLEAELTADAALFAADQNIVFFAEMDSQEFVYPDKLEQKIISTIGSDENQIMQSIDSFFASCKFKSVNVKNHLQSMAVALIYDLLKTLTEGRPVSNSIYQEANQTTQNILNCEKLSGIKESVIEFISLLSQKTDRKNRSAIAQRAVSYIHENYSKKINLDSIANDIRISPSYLSMLFKQHAGLNLTEYLNRYRIEKSKRLLSDLSIKTYEIAKEVGFRDEKYFYLLFKRYTGLTASQYRDSQNMIKCR